MLKVVFAGLLALTLQVIAPGPASAQGPKCAAAPEGAANLEPTRPPEAVPGAVFHTGSGEARTLQDYLGSGIVLNFWATWCAPCVKEMPALDRLEGLMKPHGIKVLPISEDRGGAAQVDPFYEKNGLKNLPVLLDYNRGLVRAFGVRVMPTTILINPKGQEVARVVGIAEWDGPDVVEWLKRCLSPQPGGADTTRQTDAAPMSEPKG